MGTVDAATPKVVKPTVSFTANKVSGTAPLSVTFTSKTTGNPTSYYWTFIPTSGSKGNDWNSYHAVTAGHTFTVPGKYTITLTVKNYAGSATYTKTSYITVTAPKVVKPVAIYGVSSTTGRSPWTIKYTDLSTGNPTKWLWVFGDGATSTQQNPTHTFRWTYGDGSPDVYPTSLTVSNSVGSSTVSGYSRVV